MSVSKIRQLGLVIITIAFLISGCEGEPAKDSATLDAEATAADAEVADGESEL